MEYSYSVFENGETVTSPYFAHLQFFSTNDIEKLTTPTLVKDVITVILEFFINNNANLVEWIVHKDNPVGLACRAFCDVMGGIKSDKIYLPPDNIADNIDENIWEEYIITREGFLGNNFTGSIEDIVKIIVTKTNKLKRKYKKFK
ncbi:MAG: hypothetical protein LBU51_00460 [Bacteroidales bacterium]|nr:hypothetical protein [Bacteroidales bacterium]